MSESYWNRYRLSRRRFLFAATSLGATALLGCYGNDAPAPSVPLLGTPDNTTSVAKAGGTFKTYISNDARDFDPLASASPLTSSLIAAYTYPRLLKFTNGVYPLAATGEVEGDLAESIEVSTDRLQITLRLRQGMNWDQRAPTNGRAIDAQDVVFSWNKFASRHPGRYDLVYHQDLAPGAPFESIRQIDPRTIAFRLKQPDSSALGLLASERHFYVMPRESEGGFDPRIEVRGYGPWLLTENQPGILRLWTKNPNYYVKDRPFPDKLEQVMVSEYGTRLSQFRAGLIWTSVVSQSDILSTKRELPNLILRQTDNFATAPSSLAFGYDGDSPWKDERLRQAVSLLIDRETLIDLKTRRTEFAAAGIELPVRYHTAIGAGWDGYWVDPTDEVRFGPNARFYRYDPHEARLLMQAANFSDGIETLLHYNGGADSIGYARNAELFSGLLAQGKINARLDPRPQDDWQANYYYGYTPAANIGKQIKGFSGIIYRTVTGYPTPIGQVFSTMHRAGTRFHGMTPDGKNAAGGDPDVNRMIEDMRREFDVKRQQALALEFARFMAQKAYDIPMLPYSAPNLSLSWPVIGNLGVFTGWPGGNAVTETSLHHWIDTTKPPLRAITS